MLHYVNITIFHLVLFCISFSNNFKYTFCFPKIDRISGIAAKYVGKPLVSYPFSNPITSRSPLDIGAGCFGVQPGIGNEIFGAGDLLRSVSGQSDIEKPMIIELAVAAMEELLRMAQIGEPLWTQGIDSSSETLNEEEYVRMFPRGIGLKPLGFKSEASRETAVVIMNHVNLVEILMDVVCLSFFSFL